MRACPACFRLYDGQADFCQADGRALVEAAKLERPREPKDARVGRVLLGRYRVFRTVADGGMARVYEALDEREQRHVALKILHPEVANDSISVERFRREFEVGRHLQHPNIVEVLDFQPTEDGSHVLVLEFLIGEELRALLKRERVLSPARLLRMLSQVAIAMDFAHAGQWVHRDLKPDNLFLCQTADGDIVKVLDFGSVKDKSSGAKQLTVMGTTIGSPFYMSPEQAQGLATLDHRTDVWALAAIAYECVTGRVPFFGPNGPSILLEILAAHPEPPSRRAPFALPQSFDDALVRALEKDATKRTPSVGQFIDELGRALGLPGDHVRWAWTREAELAQGLLLEPPRGGFDAAPALGAGQGGAATPEAAEMDHSAAAPSLDVASAPVGQPSGTRSSRRLVVGCVMVLAFIAGVMVVVFGLR